MATISKEKFEKVRQAHDTVLFHTDDAITALQFVHELLIAEAVAVKAKAPYATTTIKQLEQAAYQVFSLAGDIENRSFNEV